MLSCFSFPHFRLFLPYSSKLSEVPLRRPGSQATSSCITCPPISFSCLFHLLLWSVCTCHFVFFYILFISCFVFFNFVLFYFIFSCAIFPTFPNQSLSSPSPLSLLSFYPWCPHLHFLLSLLPCPISFFFRHYPMPDHPARYECLLLPSRPYPSLVPYSPFPFPLLLYPLRVGIFAPLG